MAEIDKTHETLDDYLARLNIEGKRKTWEKNRKKIDYILKKTHPYLRNAGKACDIGIGDGYLLRRLKSLGMEVTGIDISGYLIKNLKKKFADESIEIELIQADITELTFKEESFDAVTCLDILEHIPGEGLKAAIENIKGCIVKGGLLIGSLPVGENLADNMVICPKCRHTFHRIGHHHSFETFEQIKSLFEPDFQILQIGYMPLTMFKLNILNFLGFWLRESVRKLMGIKKTKLVYFVAKLNKA